MLDIQFHCGKTVLKRFWSDNRPCLWTKYLSQVDMPKMEFVGGSPNKWFIFIDNLTNDEEKLITDINGAAFDITAYLRENDDE
jgi:hypothetical protein fuD12_10567